MKILVEAKIDKKTAKAVFESWEEIDTILDAMPYHWGDSIRATIIETPVYQEVEMPEYCSGGCACSGYQVNIAITRDGTVVDLGTGPSWTNEKAAANNRPKGSDPLRVKVPEGTVATLSYEWDSINGGRFTAIDMSGSLSMIEDHMRDYPWYKDKDMPLRRYKINPTLLGEFKIY